MTVLARLALVAILLGCELHDDGCRQVDHPTRRAAAGR